MGTFSELEGDLLSDLTKSGFITCTLIFFEINSKIFLCVLIIFDFFSLETLLKCQNISSTVKYFHYYSKNTKVESKSVPL